jgi:lipid-A-disaccharide synthase
MPSSADIVRIFIAAGDPSGDIHAARLMEQIRRRMPFVQFEGIGGPAMELQGLRSLARLDQLAVTGFWEVAKRYGYFRSLLHRCAELLQQRGRYRLFLPVDYPGFNLRLAAFAKRAGVRTAYYIAPQTWAWGSGRTKAMADLIDELYVVFPFEETFFRQHGVRATHVGHPLLDDPAFTGVGAHVSRTVALLPGSRAQEVKRHALLLAQTADAVRRKDGDIAFACPVVPRVDAALYEPLRDAGVELVDDARILMRDAVAGLVKAGTSTLEASLLGLPFTTYYRTSPVSYLLSKRLIKVNSVTMMNLLLERNVVHELLQRDATPEAMSNEVIRLVYDETRREALLAASHEVRALLGGPGASARTADHVVGMLGQ